MPDLKRLIFGDRRDPRDELAEVFGSPVPRSGEVQPEALAWARQTLADAGTHDQTGAVKTLRDAEPRLGLKSAAYLASRALAPS